MEKILFTYAIENENAIKCVVLTKEELSRVLNFPKGIQFGEASKLPDVENIDDLLKYLVEVNKNSNEEFGGNNV